MGGCRRFAEGVEEVYHDTPRLESSKDALSKPGSFLMEDWRLWCDLIEVDKIVRQR